MEAKLVKSWKDISLTQFSEYSKLSLDYQEKIKDLDYEDVIESEMILLQESKYQFECFSLLSGLPKNELENTPISVIKEYFLNLDFLNKEPKSKELKCFTFKGVDYTIPKSLPLDTKYGQYVESMQSEIAWKAQDKNSVMYLAHQLAHIVDYGKDWDGEERDKLAIEFEDLNMEVFLDFSFFLQKKSKIYTAAFLMESKRVHQQNLHTTKDALDTWGILKLYMSWQSLAYLKELIKLRLIVSYIQIRDKFSIIWDTLRQKEITNTSSMKT